MSSDGILFQKDKGRIPGDIGTDFWCQGAEIIDFIEQVPYSKIGFLNHGAKRANLEVCN